MDHERAMNLLKRCVEAIFNKHAMYDEALTEMHYVGFSDDEIEELGYGYLFDDDK